MTNIRERDQLFYDLFVTAIEGGVNYWCDVKSQHTWSPDNGEAVRTFRATVVECECECDEDLHIDRATVAKGYGLATSPVWRNRISWSSDKPPVVPDGEWDFDAGDADVIVQLGLFGDVVYG